MRPEGTVVLNADDVVRVIRVVVSQMLEYLQLNSRLVLKLLLVTYYLNSHELSCFMVNCLQCLTKRTFAEEVDDFEPIRDLVTQHHVVVSAVVVEAKVELVAFNTFYLL